MDSANVKLVRSIYAAWERGDLLGQEFLSRLARAHPEWVHPEFEWIVGDGPTAGSFKGLAAAEESGRGMFEAWDELHFEAEEYRELDDERVLVLDHRSGRGKGSGVEVQANSAFLFYVRDGKVVRLVTYWDRNRALKAVGLEE
jgi:ketosteroid isomerase-like protein